MEPDQEAEHSKTVPSQFQKKTLWSAITAFAIVVIGAIAVGFIFLGATVLSYLQPVLVPLAVAGIIAYLLEPIIRWLEKRGWSHGKSMITVYIAFMIFIVVLVIAVVVPTFGQAEEAYKNRDVYQERITTLVKKGVAEIESRFNSGKADDYSERGVESILEKGPQIAGNIGEWIWGKVRGAFGFFGYLLGLLLVPIYLFYFMREGHRISETWTDYLPLRASKFKDEVVGSLTEINGYLISFFRGQMVVSLIDGALVAIALSIMGLPYALLIGVFLAILGLIPYIGNLLVMIPAILIAVAHYGATEMGVVEGNAVPEVGAVSELVLESNGKTVEKVVTEVAADGSQVEVLINAWNWLPNVWVYPLIVLLIFITLQQINGLVTAPKIVGDSVGLHPLTVIFSVLFWSLLLGGLLGALLAVPLTAAVKVLFRRYLWEKRLEQAVEKRFTSSEEEPPPSESEPAIEPA